MSYVAITVLYEGKGVNGTPPEGLGDIESYQNPGIGMEINQLVSKTAIRSMSLPSAISHAGYFIISAPTAQ
jgi:hypothetical protein